MTTTRNEASWLVKGALASRSKGTAPKIGRRNTGDNALNSN